MYCTAVTVLLVQSLCLLVVISVINLKRTQGGYTVYNTSTKKCTIKITPMPIWNEISLGIK